MPEILITGGCGFIGSAIARSYAGQADVAVIDAWLPGSGAHHVNLLGADLRRVTGDIRDEAMLADLLPGCRLVVHAAAHTSHLGSMESPRLDLGHNVDGMAALLEGIRRWCPRATLIHLSTRQVYGRPEILPVPETHPLRPPDVNGIGKVAAEDLCRLYHEVHGVDAVSLRLTNIYGPGMRVCDAKQMFLGVWIRSALEGGSLSIFGDGCQRRDLLAVEDVVRAVRAAEVCGKLRGQALNIGSGAGVSLNDLGAMVVAAAGQGTIVHRPFPQERKAIDIGDYVGAIAGAQRDLGWSPEIDLRTGIGRTVAYYREHLHAYLAEHT